jgi:hypothetical protein
MTSQGIMPGEAILTGITASTTTPAFKTYVFPNNISFSATPGMNFMVCKISNSGVTPTVRFCNTQITALNSQNILSYDLGFVTNFDGLSSQYPFRTVINTGTLTYSGITTFDASYNANDLVTKQSSTLQSTGFGFILHTI